jgi:hypothetical protein
MAIPLPCYRDGYPSGRAQRLVLERPIGERLSDVQPTNLVLTRKVGQRASTRSTR